MSLKALLQSSDEKTERVLRRVLGDLEINVDHCAASDDAVRRLTRNRFEAIVVDCSDANQAGSVMRAAKASPVNKRALLIVLVEPPVGLRGGFEMGAHFVLHKPITAERAKSSFRAVRALMRSERRLQLRIPVQIPVDCVGSSRYQATTLDLCEGGMAIRFKGRKSRESVLRFSFALPGVEQKLDVWGEMAWEGDGEQAGVRFKDPTPAHRTILRNWLNNQLPEPEADDPPVACRLTELSAAGCYVTTSTPFPKSTRVILSISPAGTAVRATGIVRLAHPEFGMGVEFLEPTTEQQQHIRGLIETLRAGGESPEVHVEPDGLETTSPGAPAVSAQASADSLVSLFHKQAQLPVEAFVQRMQQHRQMHASRQG